MGKTTLPPTFNDNKSAMYSIKCQMAQFTWKIMNDKYQNGILHSGSFQFFTWFEALNILYHRKDNKFSRLCATTVIDSGDQ